MVRHFFRHDTERFVEELRIVNFLCWQGPSGITGRVGVAEYCGRFDFYHRAFFLHVFRVQGPLCVLRGGWYDAGHLPAVLFDVAGTHVVTAVLVAYLVET